MGKYKNKKIKINQKTYILQKEIGNGANGCVWLTVCVEDSKEYAVKILKKNCDNKKTERFHKEIAFCENASNIHIIKVFGEGIVDNQQCYVMPKYSKTLRDIINTENDYIQLLYYIRQLCEAVKYIHDKAIIHRDIKPENILIDESCNLVLADFGIAHFFNSDLTQSKEWLGNKGYSAPEQLIKESRFKITAACDIYSLGKIINEVFTKQNPAGARFCEIASIEPILLDLDKLVSKCITQNPNERPNIDEVLMEICLIESYLKEQLKNISKRLKHKKSKTTNFVNIDRIIDDASKDILMAEYIFKNNGFEELEKFNINYHMNIHYKIDSFIKNIYFQKLMLDACIKKFNCEANAYKNGNPYIALNLKNEQESRIYLEFEKLLKKYSLSVSDYTGKILKNFASCCNYHCIELLRSANEIEKRVINLEDAPIIYIVYELRKILDIEEIENITLINHISINWRETKSDVLENKNLQISQDFKEREILIEFQKQWEIVFSKTESEQYLIKFWNKEKYENFKKYALALSKRDYVFEGDVIDFLRIKREHGGIIEIGPLNSFDINNTLSKLLAPR